MDPFVFVLVAGAAVLHVTWNVLLKTAGDPLRAAAVGMATAAAVICPTALDRWFVVGQPPIPTETLVLSVVSGAPRGGLLRVPRRRLPARRPVGRLSAGPRDGAVAGGRDRDRAPAASRWGRRVARGRGAPRRAAEPPAAVALPPGVGPRERGAAGFAILTGITIAAYSAVDRVGVRGTQPWIYAGLIWASGAVFLWV